LILNTEIIEIPSLFNPVQELYDSLRDKDFHVFYQPIVDLQGHGVTTVIGAEALLRISRNGRIIQAHEFIDRVRNVPDLRCSLSRFVASKVLEDCKVLDGLEVRINLYPEDIGQDHFLDWFLSVVQRSSIPPSQICVEIIESSSKGLDFSDSLFLLRKAGLKLALDDWGIEESNVSRLFLYPDEIKIDRFFVPTNGNDNLKGCILSKFAASLFGAKCTLEGIETKEDLLIAKAIGIEYGQGFYWSKAVPVQKFKDFCQ